jgi:Raf kinase inhibitor-like YbhB/YbcL family protein
MKLISPDVRNKKIIPRKFTCDGEDINPRLVIEDVPRGTKSLALIVDDPDSPMKTWVHWVVYDIPPVSRIDEDSIPGTQGMNDFEKMGYGGPCPRTGTHHYCFKLYALDTRLALKEGANKRKLEQAMQGHILDKADLVGLYKRLTMRRSKREREIQGSEAVSRDPHDLT